MFAIIHASGHQHRVEIGQLLKLDLQPWAVGDKFQTSEVLLVQTDDGVKVGAPYVPGAQVVGTVVQHGKEKKIRVFKYKSKKNYRRRYGHRTHYTSVRIDEIAA